MHYVSIVSTASCCHLFLNNWRNAHRIIIRVYIWIYHTLLWLEIILQSEWTLFDIKTTMLYLYYCHYVLKVMNNWWRCDYNGNLRPEIKLPSQNWSLCWFLCWSELVWHGFDNMSLFHKYLISGLTMNAINVRFKPIIHMLFYYSKKEKRVSYYLLELLRPIHFSLVWLSS